MKKSMTIFGAIIFASFIFSGCGGEKKDLNKNTNIIAIEQCRCIDNRIKTVNDNFKVIAIIDSCGVLYHKKLQETLSDLESETKTKLVHVYDSITKLHIDSIYKSINEKAISSLLEMKGKLWITSNGDYKTLFKVSENNETVFINASGVDKLNAMNGYFVTNSDTVVFIVDSTEIIIKNTKKQIVKIRQASFKECILGVWLLSGPGGTAKFTYNSDNTGTATVKTWEGSASQSFTYKLIGKTAIQTSGSDETVPISLSSNYKNLTYGNGIMTRVIGGKMSVGNLFSK